MIGSDTAGDDAERRTPPPCRPTDAVSALRAPDPPPSLWRDPPARARPTVAAPPRRRPARQRPVAVDVLAAAAGIGLGLTIGLAVTAESAGSLGAPGGIATALGRLAGLLAAYAMVVVVLLVARVPPLERAIGQDRLVAWHRRLGPWPLYLLLAHAVLITVGYARQAHDGVLHQLGRLLWTYPGILAATAGGALLFAAGISSYRLARRRMAYETWWSVHLYTYLALFLSFSHQVDTGASFVGHPVARAWWTALWLGTLAVVVAARIGLPVWRSLRHRVRVVGATPGGPGRRLDRPARPRAWTGCRSPGASSCSGASSAAGSGGRRTRTRSPRRRRRPAAHHRQGPRRPQRRPRPTARRGRAWRSKAPTGPSPPTPPSATALLLVGAGVGTAPVLALLQELPPGTDVTVLLRASTRRDLVLRDEVAAEVHRRGGRLVDLVGPRDEVRLDAARAAPASSPTCARREVYLCGPDALSRQLATELERSGVPRRRIHFESFTF